MTKSTMQHQPCSATFNYQSFNQVAHLMKKVAHSRKMRHPTFPHEQAKNTKQGGAFENRKTKICHPTFPRQKAENASKGGRFLIFLGYLRVYVYIIPIPLHTRVYVYRDSAKFVKCATHGSKNRDISTKNRVADWIYICHPIRHPRQRKPRYINEKPGGRLDLHLPPDPPPNHNSTERKLCP